MSTDIFDFGFTAVNEQELKSVQQTAALANDAEQLATTTQEKLDKLYNAVQPLLNNLKANPDKDYIYWPQRLEKVEQFEDHIQEIYNG
jgi:DNA helicase IV